MEISSSADKSVSMKWSQKPAKSKVLVRYVEEEEFDRLKVWSKQGSDLREVTGKEI